MLGEKHIKIKTTGEQKQMKTIKEYQDNCFQAMEGDWEHMGTPEMEQRITQWQDNLRLQ